MVQYLQLLLLLGPALAQPVSRSPAMGWRSWYAAPAHGLKDPTQAFVEASMDAMADRSRLVDGVPTSLIDLGYTRASVDGRYLGCVSSTKTACKSDCGGVNGSYHDSKGRPILNTSNFPDVKAMVAKAHGLNLTAGWYTNNFQEAGCESGWSKTPELHALHMSGEAGWMAEMGFDEVKVDSGGAFNDMTEWQRVLNSTGREIAVENCHQGGEAPNASWCPFQQWRTSGDPKVVGWQREMLDTANLLHRARRGCWAYPGYAIYGSDVGNSSVRDARTAFGAHVIMSSPLILSFDITDPQKLPCVGPKAASCTNQLDLYWDILSNKEVIAVNQNWAGSVGSLVRKWNPAHDNASSPLFGWGLPCNDSAATTAVWSVDPHTKLVTMKQQGETFCLEVPSSPDGSTVGVRPCNSSNLDQGFYFNESSSEIWHTTKPHGKMKPKDICLLMDATSTKDTPILGPFVGYQDCSWKASNPGPERMWNLTAAGQLVSQMGVHTWKSQQKWPKPGVPVPAGVAGPCFAPQHGPPNKFGPLQLWSKPQPDGAVAVFVQSTGSTWGNAGQPGAAATIKLSELPGLAAGTTKVKVRDLWNHADLPDASDGEVVSDPIDEGDSRFYLLTPA
jgi:hypothetical protein|eukprot:COSAG01_NODE_6902_length_3445_cov_6.040048_1_plen_617_part_00